MVVAGTLILAGLVLTAVCAAVLLAMAVGAFFGLLGLALGLIVLAAVIGVGALPLMLPFLILYWLLRPRRPRAGPAAGAPRPVG